MKIRGSSIIKIAVLLLVIIFAISGCSSKEPIRVAVMTKLEAGSLVGMSEVDAVKYYLNSYDITSIEHVPFDDGWDPERIPEVYKAIRDQGIDIIITSHTSTCALELKKLTDQELDDVLVFVTGSTTDQLTGIADNNIRLIQDVSMEQTSIADRIMSEGFENLIIIRDMDNFRYSEPALEHFTSRYGSEYRLMDIKASSMDLQAIEAFMKEEAFDVVYSLIGGDQTASGAIGQLAWKVNPESRIYFTPWNNAPTILNTAGPAIEQCVMASHYPSKSNSDVTVVYFDGFKDMFNYQPTYNSLHVYRAVDILAQAVEAGNATPVEIRDWILKEGSFETQLGDMAFDEFGDTALDLYFIDDIIKEYE